MKPHHELSIERLCRTLRDVMKRRTLDFSGVGVIICNSPENLPILPLSRSEPGFEETDLVSQLVTIASRGSDFHDGFHVMSDAWRLTRVAQYFSPPIVDGAVIDRSKRFGGRYLAALFGSAIPGVHLSGIATEGFGIAIFQGGREVLFEERV
ncbi:hypothetical protein [Bradyrhizobium sp. CCGB01]|uniref:hypothetical protein n=1 Tax=Bradyrhizobium sp. CCGB01 TaxID=2949634 RepID=UPI0020B1AF2A|nr:hypothetical protein [Bradyrhizobium sp. CCGB01]MCP3406141.1 hypothetical protein [Bradyrhizobium sp. CCGB01]